MSPTGEETVETHTMMRSNFLLLLFTGKVASGSEDCSVRVCDAAREFFLLLSFSFFFGFFTVSLSLSLSRSLCGQIGTMNVCPATPQTARMRSHTRRSLSLSRRRLTHVQNPTDFNGSIRGSWDAERRVFGVSLSSHTDAVLHARPRCVYLIPFFSNRKRQSERAVPSALARHAFRADFFLSLLFFLLFFSLVYSRIFSRQVAFDDDERLLSCSADARPPASARVAEVFLSDLDEAFEKLCGVLCVSRFPGDGQGLVSEFAGASPVSRPLSKLRAERATKKPRVSDRVPLAVSVARAVIRTTESGFATLLDPLGWRVVRPVASSGARPTFFQHHPTEFQGTSFVLGEPCLHLARPGATADWNLVGILVETPEKGVRSRTLHTMAQPVGAFRGVPKSRRKVRIGHDPAEICRF